ncbi:MAG TPA: YdcF family protein [Anaerolineae bacterium]|nr:YdcF family protein [Anaerolineae bacterium]
MLRRLFRALLTVAMLLLAAGAITLLYIAWRVNHTGLNDRAQPADAIVVLGAQVQPDGQPGPDLYVRTLHAAQLYQRGLAPYFVCTGGFRGDRLSAAAVACNLAVSLGVPADRVFLADGSMTTREDAASARNLMLARGWHTAILVSHPLHLERARILFEGQGLSVYPSPTNTDLSTIPWRTRAWLTARETVGIVWIGLEEIGVPYEWTGLLSQLVYGPASTIEAE